MKDKDFRGRKLKERLKKVGNESVTNCHTLKMLANDEKMRETDILSTTKKQGGIYGKNS